MNISDFLNSLEFGKEKQTSLDDIIKESYSLAFPYKMQEETSIKLLCPKCKSEVDYYADATRGWGHEGEEETSEWKCPKCGEVIKGGEFEEMDEDTPFDKSTSIWGAHPPKRQTALAPKEKVFTPEVLPKHYQKNRDALMQVLGAFGVPSATADEIIRNSESPEAKEKLNRVIFKVLTLKYGLPETEAQEFIKKYGNADVDEMIKGVMSILDRQALPGATSGAPRLGYIRESLDRLYREGLSRAKELYLDTGKINKRAFNVLVQKDPTPQKKYIEWMARTFPKMPSLTKYDVISRFDDLCNKNQIEVKDIGRYENIEQVDDAVRQAEIKYAEKSGEAQTKSGLYKDLAAITAKISKERDPEKREALMTKKNQIAGKINAMKDFLKDINPKDVIFQNENVIVVRPPDVESSCKYGRGSRWCTAAMGSRNYFNSYYFGRGVNLYYIIPLIEMHNDKFDKIAVAVYPNGEKELYDAHDARIDEKDFARVKSTLGIP
jgi:hypothetical protein